MTDFLSFLDRQRHHTTSITDRQVDGCAGLHRTRPSRWSGRATLGARYTLRINSLAKLILIAWVATGTDHTCAAEPVDAAAITDTLLDGTRSEDDRQQLVESHADLALEVIRSLTDGLDPGKEEYRRIPWVRRVAISAARRNKGTQVRDILVFSLPKVNEPLRDWQAVVIGGGIIHGLSQQNIWPREHILGFIQDDPPLQARWDRLIVRAGWMADDEDVPAGTRYDALRILGCGEWEPHGLQLLRYLSAGTHEELQRGAVSGLVDIDSPYSTKALSDAFLHLRGPNRRLAISGLLRGAGRADALLFSISAERVSSVELEADQIKQLREHPDRKVRDRADEVLLSE